MDTASHVIFNTPCFPLSSAQPVLSAECVRPVRHGRLPDAGVDGPAPLGRALRPRTARHHRISMGRPRELMLLLDSGFIDCAALEGAG